MKYFMSVVLFASMISELSSCTFLQETVGIVPRSPKVKLQALQVKSVNLKQAEIEVKLRVDNPNFFDLDFSGLDYTLDVEKTLLAQGEYNQDFTIPKDSFRVLKLPVKVDLINLIGLARDLLIKKKSTLEAHWKGTARFASTLGDIDVDFEDSKRFE